MDNDGCFPKSQDLGTRNLIFLSGSNCRASRFVRGHLFWVYGSMGLDAFCLFIVTVNFLVAQAKLFWDFLCQSLRFSFNNVTVTKLKEILIISSAPQVNFFFENQPSYPYRYKQVF